MFRLLDTPSYFPIQCATVALRLLLSQAAKKESKRTNKTREMASKLLFTADGVHNTHYTFSIHFPILYITIAHSDNNNYSWQFIYFVALHRIWSSQLHDVVACWKFQPEECAHYYLHCFRTMWLKKKKKHNFWFRMRNDGTISTFRPN